MVQQVIHKNNSLYTSDDFMMVFDVTKIEVTNFLESLSENELEEFDLLGDWLDTFDVFQVNKNKVLKGAAHRDIRLIFRYSVPSEWVSNIFCYKYCAAMPLS